jgi:hypothetical protein
VITLRFFVRRYPLQPNSILTLMMNCDLSRRRAGLPALPADDWYLCSVQQQVQDAMQNTFRKMLRGCFRPLFGPEVKTL